MKQTEIKNIIEKRFGKINSAFDKARMHLHEDDVRVFRVKVKKLAAYFQLINAVNSHRGYFKVPRKIEKIFQISATLRTLQMQQNLIQKTLEGKQNATPEAYLKLVTEKILQQKALFTTYIKDPAPLKKAEGKLLKLLPGNIGQKKLQQYISSEGNRLNDLIAPVFPSDKSLHEVRKLLKNLLYISPYSETEISALFPFTLLSSYDHVVNFTTILGSFHDLKVAVDFMHTACYKIEIDENEKTALRNIEILWIREREDVRTKIYGEIKKLWPPDGRLKPTRNGLLCKECWFEIYYFSF